MAISAKFVADFSRMQSGIEKAVVSIKTFENAARNASRDVSRLAESYSGAKIQTEAAKTVRAIESIGGVSKLTAAEQRKVNSVVTEAIAKYDALGQKAPADLRKLQKETQQVEKSTNSLGGSLGKIGGLLAGAFAVGAVTNAISKTIEYASSIKDMANQTGIGVERLQELKFAAEQSGVSFDAVGTAVFNLQKSLGKGGDGVTGALSKLGLSLKDLKGLKPEDQFTLVAGKLGQVRDQSERVTLGTALMGKGFKEVAPLIAEGLDAAIAKARALGLVLSEDTINQLEGLGDAWDAVKLAGTAFLAKALVPMVPALTAVANAVLPLAGLIGSLPKIFLEAQLAALKFAKSQAEGAQTLLRLSKITNPIGAVSGQIDKQIGLARLAAFGLGNEITLTERKIVAFGKSVAAVKPPPVLTGGGGGAPSDAEIKRFQQWRDEVTGAATEKALQQLTRDWGRLTAAERASQPVRDRVLAQYEQLRVSLPKVGGALEDLRTANLKAIPVTQRSIDLWRILSVQAIPDAATMFKAGQSAIDGLTRSGTLLSSRVVDLRVQMAAIPKDIKGASITADDFKRQSLEAADAAALWRKNLDDLAQGFATLAQIAPGSLGKVAGFLGQVTGSLNLGVKGFDSFNKGMEAFSEGDKFAGLAGMATGILGIASAVISLTTAIIGLFKTRAEKTMERVAYEFGVNISQELAQGIEDQAKREFGGNRQASKIFSLDQIISEGGGLSASNFRPLMARFRDLFSMVETGAFTSAQAVEVLDKNFRTFADFVTKGGGLANRELLEIIDLSKRFGLESRAVADFVVQQTGRAIGGLTTFLENAKVTTQESASAIAASVFGIFEAQTANGVPAAQVIASLDPILKRLDEQFTAAGLSGGAAFDQIRALATIATGEISGPAIASVTALNDVLVGLQNSGVLTQEMFGGLAAQVAQTFAGLQAQGVDGANALILMQPTLQTLWALQQDFGYAVDDSTQALLDQAEAAGQVGDQRRSIEERQLKLMERQTDALEGLARMFGVTLPDAVDRFGSAIENLPDDFTVKGYVKFEIPEPPDGGAYPPDLPGAAGGIYATGQRGVATWFGEGGEPELGGPVSFMSKALAGAMSQMAPVASGGGGDTYVIQTVDTRAMEAWLSDPATRAAVTRAVKSEVGANSNDGIALAGELAKTTRLLRR